MTATLAPPDIPFDYALAGCRGKDPEIFFPLSRTGRHGGPPDYRPAQAICEACALKTQCLDMALWAERGSQWRYGVFGGRTPEQRRLMRKVRA